MKRIGLRFKFWLLFDRKQFMPSREEALWAAVNYKGSNLIVYALMHYGYSYESEFPHTRVRRDSLVWAGCHRAREAVRAGRAGEGHLAPGWFKLYVRRVLGGCDCDGGGE